MTPNDPLVLITETWMTSATDPWAVIGYAAIALILVIGAAILTWAHWSADGVETKDERARRRAVKTLGTALTTMFITAYVLVFLPISLQPRHVAHGGEYVLVSAPLASTEAIDERQTGVHVEGSDYVLMLTGDEGQKFIGQQEGAPVTLYCDPEPTGISLKCSTTSRVDDERLSMVSVYNYVSTKEPFTGRGGSLL